MTVWPSPAGKSHPHHSGVRLGKCQANRKVNSAEPPAGIDLCWQNAPTALRDAGSFSRAPSCEKASQNNMGEFHQRPRGQPRQCVVCARPDSKSPRGRSCPASGRRCSSWGWSSGGLPTGWPSGIHSLRGSSPAACHVNVDGRLDRVVDGKRDSDLCGWRPAGCSRDSAGWLPAIPRRQDHVG